MNAVRLVRRLGGFGIRRVLLPLAGASLLLGAVGGPHATVAVTPHLDRIGSHLAAHHDLPSGTRLAVGDPAHPLALVYEGGHLSLYAPKGETLSSVVVRGAGQLQTLATKQGVDVAGINRQLSSGQRSQ